MPGNVRDVDVGNNSCLSMKEFDLDEMCENPAIVMIAKRASGKSWVCRAILKKFRDIPVGIIIAPTERMASPPFYSEFFPDAYIHYDYKSEIIEKLLYRQDVMIDKQTQKAKEGKYIDPRGFILMDDCLSKKGSWAKDQPILELLFNGRHYRIMYMLTMQFPLGISPELRGNFDYIFLLKESIYSNLKRLYDHYAGIFPTFESFRQVFKVLTDNYGVMVIVNRDTNGEFLDQIRWYKAGNDPIGMIGCGQFIKNHKENYNPDWRRKNKKFNIDTYTGKKASTAKKFTVNKINKDGDDIIE
jgi:hypothetical protein